MEPGIFFCLYHEVGILNDIGLICGIVLLLCLSSYFLVQLIYYFILLADDTFSFLDLLLIDMDTFSQCGDLLGILSLKLSDWLLGLHHFFCELVLFTKVSSVQICFFEIDLLLAVF